MILNDRQKHHRQRLHTKYRLKQRFGILWNRSNIRTIMTAIESGDPTQARMLVQQAKRSIWAIKWMERIVPVVRDDRSGIPVTILPPAWLTKFLKKNS